MSNRRRKKKASPGPMRKARPAALVVPPALDLDGVSTEPPVREPSSAELLELEVSVEREQQRERALGLARDYPRADGPLVNPLTAVLKAIPGLKPVQARLVAQALKRIGDKAHDLDEIINRMLREKHSPAEIAELVMAFQLLTEQIGAYADGIGDKLYDLFDRAKGLK